MGISYPFTTYSEITIAVSPRRQSVLISYRACTYFIPYEEYPVSTMATYAAYRHIELDNIGYGKKRYRFIILFYLFKINRFFSFFKKIMLCVFYWREKILPDILRIFFFFPNHGFFLLLFKYMLDFLL